MAHSPRRSPGPLTHTETVTRQVCSSQSLPKHTYRGNAHRKGRRGAGPTSLHNFLDVQPEQNQSRQDLEGAADGRTQERKTAGPRSGRRQEPGRGTADSRTPGGGRRQDSEGATDGRTQERQTAGAGERNGRQQDSGRGQTAGLGSSDRRQPSRLLCIIVSRPHPKNGD